LANPKWDEFVAGVVADVQQELGLDDRKLTPHLYKLLIYKTGSFFLPHSDGEKLDGMVATLVIGLPSIHEGGELIVSHEGKQDTFAMTGAAMGHELSYAAFYADCRHEVRPVRSGYRLCLTYNVTLARSRRKKGIVAPAYGATTTAIGKLIAEWSQDALLPSDDSPHKLAVTLDHLYTQDGLAYNMLKGVDRARANVLFDAAAQADCVAHLALVTHWQNGEAEGSYDDYWNRRRNRWDDYDEDDDENSGGHEMGEIFDESLSVDHWSDRAAKKVLFGEIRLKKDEIVSEISLDEWGTSREEFEGYTGNAGMTLDRWYHRAAIVIWPRAKHFAVLCDAGTDAAIGELVSMVRRLKKTANTKREEKRQRCVSFAAAIIGSWKIGRSYSWDKQENDDRSVFLPLLQELDEPDLVRRFVAQVMVIDDEMQLNKSFAEFDKRHGWSTFEESLSAVIKATCEETVVRNAELLRLLCLMRDKNADRIELCTHLADQFVKTLKAFDNQPVRHEWRIRPVDRSKLLVSLVRAMLGVDASSRFCD
jgi:hypothetical protein